MKEKEKTALPVKLKEILPVEKLSDAFGPSLRSSLFEKLKAAFAPDKLPGVFGAVFAFLMMLFHPLIYDDYYFNINRYKFAVMCYAAAAGFFACVLLNVNRMRKENRSLSLSAYLADAAMLVFLLITAIFCFTVTDKKTALMFAALAGFCLYMFFSLYRRDHIALQREVRLTAADFGMMIFVLIAFVSCMMSDYVETSFIGTNGRRNGLLCILVIGCVHVIVSRAPNARRLAVWGLVIAGAACAYVGVLNFFRIDPLGVYSGEANKYSGFFDYRLSSGDHYRFISTIGNIDFFTAFLCLSVPAVITLFITARGKLRILCLPAIVLGAAAMVVARTDGAFLCLAGSMFFAVYFGLKDKKSMVSCLAALSAVCIGFSMIGAILLKNPGADLPSEGSGVNFEFLGHMFHMNPDGPFSLEGSALGATADYPLPMAIASLLFAAGAIAVYLFLKVPEGGKSVMIRRGVFILLCAVVIACVACMFVHYTFIDTETPLTGIKKLFRFEDTWGTHRGGVWTRCLKLYGESDLRVKLIGFGPDELKIPLADAYGREIAAYSGYSYDNAHNELIQYLLTLGALGLGAYLLFTASSMYTLLRRMENCPYAAAAFAAGVTYFVHSLVTVNQPITTPLFFLLLSAGVSAGGKKKKEEKPQISSEGEKE